MNQTDLKKTRTKLSLTQSQMAEKMGLSLRGYQDKEYGKRPVTKQDEIILKILKKNQLGFETEYKSYEVDSADEIVPGRD